MNRPQPLVILGFLAATAVAPAWAQQQPPARPAAALAATSASASASGSGVSSVPPPDGSGKRKGDPGCTEAKGDAPLPARCARPSIASTRALLHGVVERAGTTEAAGGQRSTISVTSRAQSGPAEEALQIAGQIVAERATGAALELAREQLNEKFCKKAGAENVLPRSCKLVASIRLQDLAGAHRRLAQAIVQDLVAYVQERIAKDAAVPAEVKAIALLLVKSLIPELARHTEGKGNASSTRVTSRFAVDRWLASGASETLDGLTPGRRAIVVAARALAACGEQDVGAHADLADCDVDIAVAAAATAFGLETGHESELLAAAELVSHLLRAFAGRTDEGVDWRERAAGTIDAVVVATCLGVADEKEENLVGLCPAELDREGELSADKKAKLMARLSFVRFVTHAALDRDMNALIDAGLYGLCDVRRVSENATKKQEDLSDAEKTCKPEKRGLRVLAALLQYSQTYTAEGKPEEAKEARYKILDDLSRDMTDRSERDGDWVFSLGGALQLGGGYRRTVSGDGLPYGPIALPLGFGLHPVGDHFHLMVHAFDLGQYVSWQKGPVVAEPKVEYALSYGATVGVAWGSRSLPAFAAGTFSYTPAFDPLTSEQRDAGQTAKRGAWSAGAAVGIYVPLLDLN